MENRDKLFLFLRMIQEYFQTEKDRKIKIFSLGGKTTFL